MGTPHLCVTRRNGERPTVYSRGVIVHCPSCLGAAVPVLAAELPCSYRVFTEGTFEHAKAIHHFDGVISHSFNCSRLSRYDPELKCPSQALTHMSNIALRKDGGVRHRSVAFRRGLY
jgi:hypothetical protein